MYTLARPFAYDPSILCGVIQSTAVTHWVVPRLTRAQLDNYIAIIERQPTCAALKEPTDTAANKQQDTVTILRSHGCAVTYDRDEALAIFRESPCTGEMDDQDCIIVDVLSFTMPQYECDCELHYRKCLWNWPRVTVRLNLYNTYSWNRAPEFTRIPPAERVYVCNWINQHPRAGVYSRLLITYERECQVVLAPTNFVQCLQLCGYTIIDGMIRPAIRE